MELRNCSTYSEPMTSHVLGGLVDSRQMQQRADVIANIMKV